jgi:single-strand DNA-binding protein
MASFNKIVLVGNLTRDPEMRQLPSGQQVCRLGIATNRQFKNKQTGVLNQEVCFIDIDVWGAQAESCNQFLQKGKQILVEGRLKYDTWQDAQGQTRSKHSIVSESIQFLGGISKQEDGLPFNVDEENASDANKTGIEKAVKGAKKSDDSKAAKKEKATFGSGEVDFTDTPPFSDQLPF